jgi:hypothetical protein
VLSDILLLAIAVAAIVYSITLLRRADRADRQPPPDGTGSGSKGAVREFLNRRGRRYSWYLLVVSSFLAVLIIKILVLS